jgi:hypothetical protein
MQNLVSKDNPDKINEEKEENSSECSLSEDPMTTSRPSKSMVGNFSALRTSKEMKNSESKKTPR